MVPFLYFKLLYSLILYYGLLYYSRYIQKIFCRFYQKYFCQNKCSKKIIFQKKIFHYNLFFKLKLFILNLNFWLFNLYDKRFTLINIFKLNYGLFQFLFFCKDLFFQYYCQYVFQKIYLNFINFFLKGGEILIKKKSSKELLIFLIQKNFQKMDKKIN